jgi:hypothetical protein
MPTIIALSRTIKNNCRRVGSEVLFRDRIVAPIRLYIVVATLLALAFAAIAVRGFAPTLAMASSLPSLCRPAECDCALHSPKAGPPAEALSERPASDIPAASGQSSIQHKP